MSEGQALLDKDPPVMVQHSIVHQMKDCSHALTVGQLLGDVSAALPKKAARVQLDVNPMCHSLKPLLIPWQQALCLRDACC